LDAVGHLALAILVITAAAARLVEQAAADIGGVDAPVVLILELDEASAAAAIAQAFPFLARHLLERLAAPERS